MPEPKTVSGAELGARVIALEGFVRVLIHRELQRDPDALEELMGQLNASSKVRAKMLGHPDVRVHASIHTDDFLEGIRIDIEGAKT